MSTSPLEAGTGSLFVVGSLPIPIGGSTTGATVDGVRGAGTRLADLDVPTKGTGPTRVIKGLAALGDVVGSVSVSKGIVGLPSIVTFPAD